MLTLIIAAISLVVGFMLSASLLWLSAWIARIPKATLGRSALALLLMMVINIGLLVLLSRWRPQAEGLLLKAGAELGVSLLILWLGIRWCFQTSFGRAALAAVPFLLLTAASTFATATLLKTYCIEAFVTSSNSMAPTLPGDHYLGTCPHCGQPAIVPYYPEEQFRPDQEERGEIGICTKCRKIERLKTWDRTEQPPTRLICNRLLKPQRWDIIVFRYPRDPDSIYVFRLVGFPGEEVTIKQGSVWIDGAKQELPEALRGTSFLTFEEMIGFEEPGNGDKRGGDEQRVQLGPDGYFVLGDFTARASDSRVWGEVPSANLLGVVDLIYWPPSRWTVFR